MEHRDVVATVGQDIITAEALGAELTQRGGRADKAEVLEELIRFRVLLAKAKAEGMDRDPAFRAAWERALVSRYQEQALAQREQAGPPVTEAEVETYYQQHRQNYASPARMRLGVLFLKSSAKADEATRRALAERAAGLRAEAVRADAAGFAELVQRHSDDQATRYQGGDTGWLQVGDAASRWEPEVLAAGAALTSPGEVGPVVSTDRGRYVVRLQAADPAGHLSLGQVADRIRSQLARERVRQRLEAFFEESKAGMRIEVNQAVLEGVRVPVRAGDAAPPALPGG